MIYTVQLGYIFIFPFILQNLYGLQLDTISLLLLPGYVTAVIIGALSGEIADKLNSTQTTVIAIISIIISLILPGVLINGPVIIFVISMMLFSGAYALMYAPLLERCVSTIPPEKSGTAIGFYNLTLIFLFTLAIISAIAALLYWILVKSLKSSV